MNAKIDDYSFRYFGKMNDAMEIRFCREKAKRI